LRCFSGGGSVCDGEFQENAAVVEEGEKLVGASDVGGWFGASGGPGVSMQASRALKQGYDIWECGELASYQGYAADIGGIQRQ